jgi:uncharacterized protein (DUF2062 family)
MRRSMTSGQFNIPAKLAQSLDAAKRNAASWLCQGISPRRLALTLALGIAVGCIPVVGIPTLVCAALALALRLNLPAIQAANYAVMPLQLLLIVPFVRFGGWLIAGQALLAWLVLAIPTVLLLTFTLPLLLRRIPVVAAAEAGD